MEKSVMTDKKTYSCVLEGLQTATNLTYLAEGDQISADMVTDNADVDLSELLDFATNVCVDKTYDEEEEKNIFDFQITVETPEDADALYNWILGNEFAADDDEVEEIAPGLIAFMNGDAEPDGADAPAVEDTDDMPVEESVSSRFARYRKLYEGDEEDSDENGGNDSDEDAEKDGDSEGEDEEIPMTAIIVEVKKGDEEDCKKEMVDAGVDEEDIEIVEGDDDDETVQIKVDVNSITELKKYLDGKGIDLEEKIGGEIVDDSEDGGDGSDSDSDEDGEDGDKKKDGADVFKDEDFKDLFGDE